MTCRDMYQDDKHPVESKIYPAILILVATVIGLEGLAVAAQYFPKTVSFVVVAIVGFWALSNALRWTQRVKWPSTRVFAEKLRTFRKFWKAPPFAIALYSLCSALAALTFCVSVLIESPIVWVVGAVAISTMLLVASVFDWYVRLQHILSFKVGQLVVKGVGTLLLTTAVFVATVVANHLTHQISYTEPASMPEFVRLVAALAYPLVLAAVVAGTMFLISLVQYLLLLFGMMIAAFENFWLMFLGEKLQNKLKDIRWRLLYGKRLPKKWRASEFLMGGVQYVMRPIGSFALASLPIAIVFGLWQLISLIPDHFKQVALVTVEYHAPHLCENVSANLPIAYLNDGYVSVATPVGKGFAFSVAKCHKN